MQFSKIIFALIATPLLENCIRCISLAGKRGIVYSLTARQIKKRLYMDSWSMTTSGRALLTLPNFFKALIYFANK
jgi:hypothetical protein